MSLIQKQETFECVHVVHVSIIYIRTTIAKTAITICLYEYASERNGVALVFPPHSRYWISKKAKVARKSWFIERRIVCTWSAFRFESNSKDTPAVISETSHDDANVLSVKSILKIIGEYFCIRSLVKSRQNVFCHVRIWEVFTSRSDWILRKSGTISIFNRRFSVPLPRHL